ncbi:hypothetical protein [Mechercharimyces sp. CAU 1602]|uniref:hypothetical protein n=1 Tax=Mechercharimyces sp. CAU 1602 TaxID=2973933 RepID=UPI0021639F8C|nr:hypothetical protein [Mechercharimyces sp. CAU 1602]MCS1350902.1 hypothetical protein [Mechercharimyces sp. CAU 1602]
MSSEQVRKIFNVDDFEVSKYGDVYEIKETSNSIGCHAMYDINDGGLRAIQFFGPLQPEYLGKRFLGEAHLLQDTTQESKIECQETAIIL